MRNLINNIDNVFEHIKSLKADIKKYNKLQESYSNMTFENTTQKRRQKVNVDMNWLAMEIDKSKYYLHCELVKAGLSEEREDEYYTDKEYHPSGFHDYVHHRSKEDLKEAQ